ncbi:hypothetical protein WH47_09297 [Habropoda laboriosa]|uniref:Uncharacterized protein n=1 Tax=Habropoda laboriosa TaxID=597456 RepID=A0A0L7R932_9HYME|nr:hypothetical protein WH47_09297 [Habropoda laboriosa]
MKNEKKKTVREKSIKLLQEFEPGIRKSLRTQTNFTVNISETMFIPFYSKNCAKSDFLLDHPISSCRKRQMY